MDNKARSYKYFIDRLFNINPQGNVAALYWMLGAKQGRQLLKLFLDDEKSKAILKEVTKGTLSSINRQ